MQRHYSNHMLFDPKERDCLDTPTSTNQIQESNDSVCNWSPWLFPTSSQVEAIPPPEEDSAQNDQATHVPHVVG